MILESIRTGLKNLFANKLRSTLSMLGIIFGVGSLVATMSIGEGTRREILRAVEDLGSNLIRIDSQRVVIRRSVRTPGLLYRDVGLLREHSPAIELISPVKIEHGWISYGGKQLVTLIQGTNPDFEEISNFYVARGRFISDRDIDENAKVCVIGADLADRLEAEDLLGETLRINNGSFIVVGVMERLGKSQRWTHARDMNVFVPISVAREISASPEGIDQIVIKAAHASIVEKTGDQIEELLTHFHGGHKDFQMETQAELLRKREEYARVFKLALGSIAIVSLVIGGIGIMNILLASVSERIKEIGIRKALGAGPFDILFQFLFESLILTVSGGAVGVIIGKFMAARIAPLLEKYMKQMTFRWQAVTTTETVLVAFTFAIVTGFIFGLYPAVKASRLDPSEALTYE